MEYRADSRAKRQMYPNLRWQLWKCGMRQNRLAQLVGIHETLLSRILNGYREPDHGVRLRIAAVLQSDPEWLFDKQFLDDPRPGGGVPAGKPLPPSD